MKRAPPQRSLKACALQYLAQREHSPLELRNKLIRHSVNQGLTDAKVDESKAQPVTSALTQVDALLAELVTQGHLCAERFIESRIRTRAPRFGNARIQQEIKQHALILSSAAIQTLQASELERACTVRARKFAHLPANIADQVKQARFLVGRGFSHEVVRRALREAPSNDSGPTAENETSDD
jgi:regulatory protein